MNLETRLTAQHESKIMEPISYQPATILTIDDDRDILIGLETVLTAAGQACVTASSPDEAEQMVSQHSFDMIICDINLDGHSGLELIAKLRKREELREIPVIFLSGAEIPNIVKRAHAAGGNYYLRKPFDPSVLTELIDRALWMPHVAGVNAGM